MMKNWKKVLLPGLFTLGGAVVGLAYYVTVGCAGGSCAITASPTRSVIYMAVIGWLLSQIFVKQQKEMKGENDEK